MKSVVALLLFYLRKTQGFRSFAARFGLVSAISGEKAVRATLVCFGGVCGLTRLKTDSDVYLRLGGFRHHFWSDKADYMHFPIMHLLSTKGIKPTVSLEAYFAAFDVNSASASTSVRFESFVGKGGGKINARDAAGETAIIYAATKGTMTQKLETIDFLQKNGAKINAASKNGKTLTDMLRSDRKVIGDMRYWDLLAKINGG